MGVTSAPLAGIKKRLEHLSSEDATSFTALRSRPDAQRRVATSAHVHIAEADIEGASGPVPFPRVDSYVALDLYDNPGSPNPGATDFSNAKCRVYIEGLTTGMFLPARRSQLRKVGAALDDEPDEEGGDPRESFATLVRCQKACEAVVYLLAQGLLGGCGLWYIYSTKDAASICALGNVSNESRRFFFIATRYPFFISMVRIERRLTP
ncbi:hypothetical protein ACHHYP_04990 [Achlya hypogyna]|uniref:Uncharacterized protein n=1 Tax=Achlya hypogyna TaxID=1202772 RepID=A0A1V9YZN0_ACHHY|nr:hypothetical protein ACHHYP_04990 [Achlya hypogyna]